MPALIQCGMHTGDIIKKIRIKTILSFVIINYLAKFEKLRTEVKEMISAMSNRLIINMIMF